MFCGTHNILSTFRLSVGNIREYFLEYCQSVPQNIVMDLKNVMLSAYRFVLPSCAGRICVIDLTMHLERRIAYVPGTTPGIHGRLGPAVGSGVAVVSSSPLCETSDARAASHPWSKCIIYNHQTIYSCALI